MALLKRKRRDDELDMQLAPMIDVVFLLLIFFMCVTKPRTLEGELMAHLPKSGGVHTEQPTTPLEDAVITLLPGGIVELSGRLIGQGTTPAQVDQTFNNLAKQLAYLRKMNEEQAAVLDGAPKVKFRFVIRSLDACKAARIKNVKFALTP